MDVSAYARGLLSLLNSKSLGVGFAQISDYLQATVDAEPFLGLQNRRLVNFPGGFNAGSGGNNALVVPVGEMWIVRAAGAFLQPDATGLCAAACMTFAPPETLVAGSAGQTVVAGPGKPVLAGANNLTQLEWGYPDIILTSGTTIGINCAGVTNTIAAQIVAYVEAHRV